MHVNTTSAFDVNYKIAITCIKLHWQFHKMFRWIIQMNIQVRACVQSVHHQHAHMISDGHASTFRSKSKQVCIKCFHRSSMSWIFVSYTLCCLTPQISKYKAHDDPGSRWWSYEIHLMQFSLVISHCNITYLVFWLSQGSVATLIRWGGWSSYCHTCHSFLNLSVKTVLKSVDFWQSYREK